MQTFDTSVIVSKPTKGTYNAYISNFFIDYELLATSAQCASWTASDARR